MLELIKALIEFIKKHFREMERNSPAVRGFGKTLRYCSRTVTLFVISSPILALFMALPVVLTYLALHPELAGRTACYWSAIDYDKIVPSGRQRPCDERKLTALYWEVPQNEVSKYAKGSLLVHSTILEEASQKADTWFEVYVQPERPLVKPPFNPSLPWSIAVEGAGANNYAKDTCQTGYDPLPDGSRPVTEPRLGFLLKSSDRSGGGLAPEQRLQCDYADSSQNPKYAYCNWRRFEMFVPYLGPNAFCKEKTFWEYWTGKREFPLAKPSPLCFREVRLDGSYSGPWESLGTIRAAWCD
jgi:hypothetical protein